MNISNNDDFNISLDVVINQDIGKINADIKKLEPKLIPLSVTIQTLFEVSKEAIRKHLANIQSYINSQKPISVSADFDGAGKEQAARKYKQIFSDIAKDISAKLAEAFSITDKKALAEITKLSDEWVKLVDTFDKSHIEDDIFSAIYDAIKNFDSTVNFAKDNYEEFVKFVNSSKIQVKPFGDGEAYEKLRKSFGVGVISSQSGLPLDSWFQQARNIFPDILPDVANVEDQFEELHTALVAGRDLLKGSKITNQEIEEYFGGKNGIREAMDSILDEIRNVSQNFSDVPLTLPVMDIATDWESLSSFIDELERRLEGLSDDEKKIPVGVELSDPNILKTVDTIDAETSELIKRVTTLNEGLGITRQVFEAVNDESGQLEATI